MMMMIREMTTEQLNTLVIGKPCADVGPSRYDWSQVWPVVDQAGVVREIVDGTEEAPSHLVYDDSNDCYRWASECCAICDAAGQVTVATTERDGRPLCEACAAEVDAAR